jgi:hypothetical protein
LPECKLNAGSHILLPQSRSTSTCMSIVTTRINGTAFSNLIGHSMTIRNLRPLAHSSSNFESPGLAKIAAAPVIDTLRASHASYNSIKLYVYTLQDTMNFILGGTDPYSESRQQIVHRINYYRSTVGLGDLTRRLDKDSCLDAQAAYDASSNTAHAGFGRCGENAQNECPNWNSETQIITGCTDDMWNEGPGTGSAHGHYVNMTGKAYHQISVGFYKTSSNKFWSLQDYWP